MNTRHPSLPAPPAAHPGGRRQAGFSLVELMTAVAILSSLAAVSIPVVGAVVRDTQINNATSRLRAGLQQARAILTDYPMADRGNTSPRIAGASFAGTALLLRWDDVKQDYDISYALSHQNAANPALAGTVAPGVLARYPGETNAGGYLATAGYWGYSSFMDLEPMTLGTGLRVAGLRRNDAATGKLELVPSPSFAICMNPLGVGLPPDARIYVNLQEPPPAGGSGPWTVWDTTMYDDAGTSTGAYAESHAVDGGTGEGFWTSLPMVIVYRDDDLPQSGNSPSGTPWRIANAGGQAGVNPALDPNELLVRTKGRMVTLTLQGGSPVDY